MCVEGWMKFGHADPTSPLAAAVVVVVVMMEVVAVVVEVDSLSWWWRLKVCKRVGGAGANKNNGFLS